MGHESEESSVILPTGQAVPIIERMQIRPLVSPRISRHAVDRYRQRVEPVSPELATARLAELAVAATRRPTPRWWTAIPPGPGVLFLYPHKDPDVCLIMRSNTIVTVVSRVVSLAWRSDQASAVPRPPRRQPYRRPSPGWPLDAA
jgi:hypothetical protein